jgi:hypothetical protein
MVLVSTKFSTSSNILRRFVQYRKHLRPGRCWFNRSKFEIYLIRHLKRHTRYERRLWLQILQKSNEVFSCMWFLQFYHFSVTDKAKIYFIIDYEQKTCMFSVIKRG